MIEWSDIAIGTAIVALLIGLGMIYLPLAFILPSTAVIAWEAWRLRNRRRRK